MRRHTRDPNRSPVSCRPGTRGQPSSRSNDSLSFSSSNHCELLTREYHAAGVTDAGRVVAEAKREEEAKLSGTESGQRVARMLQPVSASSPHNMGTRNKTCIKVSFTRATRRCISARLLVPHGRCCRCVNTYRTPGQRKEGME